MNTTITFPWPDRKLHPNEPVVWQAKIEPTKTARSAAYWLTLASDSRWVMTGFIGPMEALYVFYPPDNRYRDLSNMADNCKAITDGVMDALHTDDRNIRRIINEWGEVRKGGAVVMTLRPFDDGSMKF